jgi:plastocyanin
MGREWLVTYMKEMPLTLENSGANMYLVIIMLLICATAIAPTLGKPIWEADCTESLSNSGGDSMRISVWHLALLVLAVFFTAAACSSPATVGPSGEITITQQEYEFIPDAIKVKAGQEVRITLVNQGEKEHEFMVGRNVMVMNDVPSGFMTDFFEDIEVRAERNGQPVPLMELMGHDMDAMEAMGHSGFMVAQDEGSAPVTLIFTVPADRVGEWTIGCFEDDGDHWEEGMKGKLIVE